MEKLHSVSPCKYIVILCDMPVIYEARSSPQCSARHYEVTMKSLPPTGIQVRKEYAAVKCSMVITTVMVLYKINFLNYYYTVVLSIPVITVLLAGVCFFSPTSLFKALYLAKGRSVLLP